MLLKAHGALSFKKYLYLVNQCTERVKTIAFDSPDMKLPFFELPVGVRWLSSKADAPHSLQANAVK